ncbi:MAG: aldo/keto reductase [Balneolaceae bacterium]
MNYRTLGKNGPPVSEIGFGCMSLHSDPAGNHRLIRTALDEGINLFDTADLYDRGANEECLGRALEGVRERAFIATKVGNRWREDGSGWDWAPRRDHVVSAVEKSLQRLRTDRIDLYQMHGGTIDDPIDEIIETLETLRKSGKIRYWGISSIRPNVIREYLKRGGISSVMMQYSLLDRRPEEQCLGLLQNAGVGVLARGTLAKGVLIDKPPAEMAGYSPEETKKMQVAAQAAGNPIGAAIGFVLNRPEVTSAVTGIRTAKQLEEILKGYRNQVGKSAISRLASLLPPNQYENHR